MWNRIKNVWHRGSELITSVKGWAPGSAVAMGEYSCVDTSTRSRCMVSRCSKYVESLKVER